MHFLSILLHIYAVTLDILIMSTKVVWLYDPLTVMIASIGATNAQITPFSVDNQQLEATK